MASTAAESKVILLFDSYTDDSIKLHQSFLTNHCRYPAVVIEDDGFLPEGIQSVYGYFLGDYKNAPKSLGRPRYFNEVLIPDFWEITANNASGQVFDLFRERARIFYFKSSNKRQVKAVDWLDEYGMVRYSDHYNRYGGIYARTTFNEKGEKVIKSYFSPEGKEVITENFVTRDIILNQGDVVLIFNNKTEFVSYFLKHAGYDSYKIYFNSLSTPFFVSCYLNAGVKKDVLFWQEPVGVEIPGNMHMILRGESRTQKIFVQKRKAYQRLMELGADPSVVKQKGFCYSFLRENQHRPEALICTNSDQIPHCEQMIQALPQVQFHIAAVTEMSSKLMSFEKYENVHLYPGIKTSIADRLFQQCDLYLDINRGNEILSAVHRGFMNNQVIFAFRETIHNVDDIDENNIFGEDHPECLIEAVQNAISSSEIMDQMISMQHTYALAETGREFLNLD